MLRYGPGCGFKQSFLNVLKHIKYYNCNSAQFSAGDPTSYFPADLRGKEEEILLFRKDAPQYFLFLHSSYLVNLASPRDDIWKPSIRSIFLLRKLAYDLGVGAIVVHAGSHDDSGVSVGIKRYSDAIKVILTNEENLPVKFLIENTAGGGTSIGGQPKNIKSIIDNVADDRVGMVLDTAHAYASGIDLNSPKDREYLYKYYLDCIELIHLNDTNVALGSHLDRHSETHLEEGELTSTALSFFVEKFPIPLVVEVKDHPERDFEKIKEWYKKTGLE